MNFYQRHLGDYARDTRHLTLLEHGVYNMLLDIYYASEKGIPDAEAERLVGAKSRAEKMAVRVVLKEFFSLRDGEWLQARCMDEIEKARKKAEISQKNGMRGGRPKTQNKPSGFPPESNNQKPESIINTTPASAAPLPPANDPNPKPPQNSPRPPHAPSDGKPKALATTIPPAIEQVIAFGGAIGLPKDECQAFVDHFEANGWKVSGKTPMRNWQAALRTWKRNWREGAFRGGKAPLPVSRGYEQAASSARRPGMSDEDAQRIVDEELKRKRGAQ